MTWLLAAVFFLISVFFVYRVFYGMRIGSEGSEPASELSTGGAAGPGHGRGGVAVESPTRQ